MYKIAKENLQTLYREIAKNQELFLPEKIGEQVNFAPYREELETDLTVLKTVKSPKDVFFPQSENLYTCVEKDRKITIEPEKLQEQKFVVFRSGGYLLCSQKRARNHRFPGLRRTRGDLFL